MIGFTCMTEVRVETTFIDMILAKFGCIPFPLTKNHGYWVSFFKKKTHTYKVSILNFVFANYLSDYLCISNGHPLYLGI